MFLKALLGFSDIAGYLSFSTVTKAQTAAIIQTVAAACQLLR